MSSKTASVDGWLQTRDIWQVEKSETCHNNNAALMINGLINGDNRYWGVSGDSHPVH